METWITAGYEPSLPVTEKSNPLTRDIDKADAKHIVHLLKNCDAEIFKKEWDAHGSYQTLSSESVIQKMVHLAKKVEEILKDPEESLIVMSGCGTSGRLAFLLATSFNGLLKELQHDQIYYYIIAGGDKALLTSQESTEDSPQRGAEMLRMACEGKKRVLFIGISCGLSAPFVAGQIDFCMHNMNVFTPVVIGFNPVKMARNEPICGWPLTFRRVLKRMEELQKSNEAFIINPVLGPEAISGSSRLKGGSATKIVLETIFLAGHEAFFSSKNITVQHILNWMEIYKDVHTVTYSQSDKIAFLVQQVGESLQQSGHVYYVGWSSLGVMGVIDASECIPTFGADIEDVRGFIWKGYDELKNNEGDLSSVGPAFRIGHVDFVNDILPHVSKSDIIIFLFALDDDLRDIETLANQTKLKTSNLHAVYHAYPECSFPIDLKKVFSSVLSVAWPAVPLVSEGYHIKELSTKWILNAISTGGHILKGKIYCNYMLDLKVTNTKLFKRAVNILQKFTRCSYSESLKALLQAIYDVEELTGAMTDADVIEHTIAASTRTRVLPTALVILIRRCSISEAKSRLDAHPVIREAVEACLAASQD
ncbi:glucokinase regulatory protein isoform X2 [Paramormyrops kingsleyae]|uniref:glucokinase regulatory protein isoform X2 n=1 Tax=Paramormyrops kingsleyae TaxID=1676925 RepID=UPI000CD610ED|nr:glucokinase regulatory protein isoform X2 [Paramormyrops kingsleyae]